MVSNDVLLLAEVVANIATTLGILVAGVWSLWLFYFSRTFAGTLSISLSLTGLTLIGDIPAAIISVKVKNVGRTRVKKGYCLIAARPIDEPFPSERSYFMGTEAIDYMSSREIFESLLEVEPNEESSEEVVLVLGNDPVYKVGVRFKQKNSPVIWESAAIFNVSSGSDD